MGNNGAVGVEGCTGSDGVCGSGGSAAVVDVGEWVWMGEEVREEGWVGE